MTSSAETTTELRRCFAATSSESVFADKDGNGTRTHATMANAAAATGISVMEKSDFAVGPFNVTSQLMIAAAERPAIIVIPACGQNGLRRSRKANIASAASRK